MSDWPKYLSRKIVRAMPITAVTPSGVLVGPRQMCDATPGNIPDGVDVTPAMVAAAIIELHSWQDSQDWREGNLVTRIFLAMRNAAPNCPPRATSPSRATLAGDEP